MLAIVVAGAVYVAHYEPIRVGAVAGSGQYVDPSRVDLDGDLRAYTYHEGGLIIVGLAIDNGGRLPITVTGIAQSPGYWEGLISVVAPRLGPDSDPIDLSVATPFHAFALSRGDHRWLDVVFRMGHCANNDPDTSMSMTSVTVHYTVLGVHRAQELPLGTGVWVTAPSRADCPTR